MKGKIFNAQEVQVIIAGNKTQFSEVIKFSNSKTTRDFQEIALKKILEGFSEYNVCLSDLFKVPYQVGQEIFCKESFEIWDDGLVYKADNSPANIVCKWKPAQHMQQEHSRLTLQITGIRVERLQSIGCTDFFADTGRRPISHMDLDCDTPDPRNDFKVYWNATHKKPEERFEANPFVFVYSFGVTT